MDMNKTKFKNNLLVGSAQLNRALLQNSCRTRFKPHEPQTNVRIFWLQNHCTIPVICDTKRGSSDCNFVRQACCNCRLS